MHRPAAPRRPVYVVQPGDSLTAIAARFGLTVHARAANRLDPAAVLLIGTHLDVPQRRGADGDARRDVQARLDAWARGSASRRDLVRALAWMESGYQPSVVSSVGARGVLQVLPKTRDFVEQVLVGHPVPQTLDGDIEVGVLYLRHLLASSAATRGSRSPPGTRARRRCGSRALQGDEAVRRRRARAPGADVACVAWSCSTARSTS